MRGSDLVTKSGKELQCTQLNRNVLGDYTKGPQPAIVLGWSQQALGSLESLLLENDVAWISRYDILYYSLLRGDAVYRLLFHWACSVSTPSQALGVEHLIVSEFSSTLRELAHLLKELKRWSRCTLVWSHLLSISAVCPWSLNWSSDRDELAFVLAKHSKESWAFRRGFLVPLILPRMCGDRTV